LTQAGERAWNLLVIEKRVNVMLIWGGSKLG
jgi:hypothetical protein